MKPLGGPNRRGFACVAAWRNRDICYMVSLNHAINWEKSEYGARGISLACPHAPNRLSLQLGLFQGGLAAADCEYNAQ